MMRPTRTELRSGILAGVLAGLPLGVILHLGAGGDAIRTQATVYVADPSIAAGWIALLVHSLVFGFVFAGMAFVLTSTYINHVLSITSRSEAVAGAFLPLIDRFGMTVVVSTAMAFKFGLAIWLLFPVSILPTVSTIPQYAFPQVETITFLGYLVYGLVLGPVYGVQIRG